MTDITPILTIGSTAAALIAVAVTCYGIGRYRRRRRRRHSTGGSQQ